MDWEIAYTAFVGIVILQRLIELVVSQRNVSRLRASGGVEFGAGHYPWMVALHTAFLVSCIAEPRLLDRPIRPVLALSMLVLLTTGLALRVWTFATLRNRWTTRVIVVPGEIQVTTGPYRFFRHPNYLAVVLEIIAIPMIHTAWLTATVFSVLNAVILSIRISTEDRALRRFTSKDLESGKRVGTQQ